MSASLCVCVCVSGRRQWCAIGVLVTIMIVVLILFFALWSQWPLTSRLSSATPPCQDGRTDRSIDRCIDGLMDGQIRGGGGTCLSSFPLPLSSHWGETGALQRGVRIDSSSSSSLLLIIQVREKKNKTKPRRRSSTRGNLGGVTDFKLVHFGYCGRKRYWAWESRREAAAVSLKRSKSTPDHFTSVSVTACNHTQPVAEKCAHVDKSANIK